MRSKSVWVMGLALALAGISRPVAAGAANSWEAEMIVNRAFEEVLHRRPDNQEMRHYRDLILDDDWSEFQVRQDLSRQGGGRGRGGPEADPDMVINRAYEDILNRRPDPEGLRHYRSLMIDDGWSERQVRDDLRRSKEARGIPQQDPDTVIRRAYQDLLGRKPDPAGLQHYRHKMTEEGWSEKQVRDDLRHSDEYRQHH